ncbi:L,D-transpeptidase [Ramlibacter sp. PS4R-6]|uniref:L,D-transpeptidase n=1 Tax=Ramlibacter sp. PS4R-6 TaxID=3133438 RepID=UPI0030AD3960
MDRIRQALAAALLGLACALPAAAAEYKAPPVSRDTRELAQWVLQKSDHGARAFAIVDKKSAHLYIFDASGRLQGDTPVLLGQQPGDDSAPNVGEHAQQGFVPFHERTTPAGRFEAEAGVNDTGEQVIWVDYDSAFAIHRLRPGRAMRDREARLRSTDMAERRASSGCVVVPVRFFEDVVLRWLGESRSVVYVLPESGSARDIAGSL